LKSRWIKGLFTSCEVKARDEDRVRHTSSARSERQEAQRRDRAYFNRIPGFEPRQTSSASGHAPSPSAIGSEPEQVGLFNRLLMP